MTTQSIHNLNLIYIIWIYTFTLCKKHLSHNSNASVGLLLWSNRWSLMLQMAQWLPLQLLAGWVQLCTDHLPFYVPGLLIPKQFEWPYCHCQNPTPKSTHIHLSQHLTQRLKMDCSPLHEWGQIQKHYNSPFH